MGPFLTLFAKWLHMCCGAAFVALWWLCCFVAALVLCWRRFGAMQGLLGSAGGVLQLCRRCARLVTSFFLYVFACLPACMPACLPACLSICVFFCLFVCLFVCLSVCLPICLFVCGPVIVPVPFPRFGNISQHPGGVVYNRVVSAHMTMHWQL